MLEILDHIIKNSQLYVLHDPIQEKPSNSGAAWTEKEEDQLKKLYLDKNKDVSEISIIHGRSVGGILSRLKKLQLLKDTDDPYIPLADSEIEHIKRLYIDENKDIEAIATIYNRSVGGIRSRLKKLNILKQCDIENCDSIDISEINNCVTKVKKRKKNNTLQRIKYLEDNIKKTIRYY
jgi:hypothetical protein